MELKLHLVFLGSGLPDEPVVYHRGLRLFLNTQLLYAVLATWYIKSISRVCQEYIKSISRVYQEYIKYIKYIKSISSISRVSSTQNVMIDML